jgi:hypothetical protein
VRKYSDVHTCPLFTNVFLWQQAGGAIVMDADATSALHKKGVSATDDSFKFICFEVSACIFVGCKSLFPVFLSWIQFIICTKQVVKLSKVTISPCPSLCHPRIFSGS